MSLQAITLGPPPSTATFWQAPPKPLAACQKILPNLWQAARIFGSCQTRGAEACGCAWHACGDFTPDRGGTYPWGDISPAVKKSPSNTSRRMTPGPAVREGWARREREAGGRGRHRGRSQERPPARETAAEGPRDTADWRRGTQKPKEGSREEEGARDRSPALHWSPAGEGLWDLRYPGKTRASERAPREASETLRKMPAPWPGGGRGMARMSTPREGRKRPRETLGEVWPGGGREAVARPPNPLFASRKKEAAYGRGMEAQTSRDGSCASEVSRARPWPA